MCSTSQILFKTLLCVSFNEGLMIVTVSSHNSPLQIIFTKITLILPKFNHSQPRPLSPTHKQSTCLVQPTEDSSIPSKFGMPLKWNHTGMSRTIASAPEL